MTRTMILTEAPSDSATPADLYPAKWIRLPTRGHCPHTGLSRAMFYELIKANKIRSASLKRPGTIRGARLVWLPSVMAYLEQFVVGNSTKAKEVTHA